MRMHHVGLEVSDLTRSLHFYQEVVGFQPERYLTLNGEELAFLRLGEARLELVRAPVVPAGEDRMHLSFEVDDLTAIVDRLSREQVAITEGPCELENGWKNVFVNGPDGETIEFVEIGANLY